MRFMPSFLELLQPETAKLLNRADRMTDADAETIARTTAWIKATDYAYANQDWAGYIGAVYFAMWSMQCCGSKYQKRLLQYSNDFIAFGQAHLQEAIARASSYTNWATRTYVNTFSYIYDFYYEYYQIGDAKIEELLALYHQAFRANPSPSAEYHYQFTKMRYGMSRRDAKQTAAALRRVQALQQETQVCYVCQNRDIIGALLLVGRTDEALHRIKQIVSDEGLPEWWYDDYRHCENANAYAQYSALLRYAFDFRQPDMVRRFAQEYQSEILSGDDVDWDGDFMVLVITRGADVRRAQYLEELSTQLEDTSDRMPLTQLNFLLHTWAYLEMLHQSGVETVALSLLKPPIAEQDGLYNTHALADYYLKQADKLGAKFDQTRPSFQYQGLRDTALSLLDPI